MKYEIYCEYSSGDSESQWESSSTLAPTWENLEVAKTALKYLTEHHYWYCLEKDETWSLPEEIRDKKPDYYRTGAWWLWDKFRSDFNRKHNPFNGYDLESSLMLPMDNGEFLRVSVPYHGYFEHLKGLEIRAVAPEVDDRKVRF